MRPPKSILLPALALLAWPALAAEVLYNGIVLPEVWPPRRAATLAVATPDYLVNPPAVIPIDVGRQLFVDDFLIAETSLMRTPHRPALDPASPVLRPDTRPDNLRAMPYSDGAWYDPTDKFFKIWYWGGWGASLSLASSPDGRHWTRPTFPDSPLPNSNVVLDFGGGRDASTEWMDLEESNPALRFKAFTYVGGGRLTTYGSPDGIHWTRQEPRPLSLSDRTTVFWNPFRKRWVTSARSRAALAGTALTPGRTSRGRFYSESADLETWNPSDPYLSYWTGPDELDLPYPGSPSGSQVELYNLDAVAYESVLVGLFSWYYPPPGPDLVELGAGFSRDGFQWSRPARGAQDKAFIRATGIEGAWNGFNIQSVGGCFLVVGDQLWFYFSARDTRHNEPSKYMSTGLAILRRDGFYSMDAGPAQGTLTTRPLTFRGRYLFVNVDSPGGELRAEVLDRQGNVIQPFSYANSVPVSADSTRLQMRWNGGQTLARLAGTPVRIRFYLTNGALYSFWVTPDPDGASYGYVAAGGPGLSQPIDLPD